MKIVSIVLLLVSALLSLKHGWDAFQPPSPQQAKMMADLGITKSLVPVVGALSIAIGLLLLFPQTFFVGNVLNAVVILLIMAFSLRAGNVKTALIEIPFLCLPLLMIWLKYPFKF
ncbi:hypothetical protein SAMN05421788_107317 [Filimonas lacunae]|uniref:DoxX-like family protein n=1 Tax=Filimonas lacunae TaxID=477680 RepID=A0A173MGQ9_9BACT|nr:hypothetical protein [Filimonas lacunae]BAV06657.1 hypothetical protein FLA_2676 [Filimonas lacunae]SIT27783.1 hypothetical protein SAMN05421788_107317 [Filimonas lacunae]